MQETRILISENSRWGGWRKFKSSEVSWEWVLGRIHSGCSRGLHLDLHTVHTRCISAVFRTGFPARPCHGDAQRAPRKGGRGTGSWQTASPENRDQWRARIKAPLNFNGFCAMPLYLPHYFLAIKSAHSALPYATRLKTHASRRKSPLLRANSPLSTARAHTSCLPSLEPSLFPSLPTDFIR